MKNLALSLCLLALVSSCASKKYNPTQIEKVRRVAILSFVVYQDKPKDSLGLGSLTKGAKNGNSESSPEMKQLAQNTYSYLAQALSKKIGKEVLPLKTVKSDAEYRQFYKKKMEGFRLGGYQGDKVEMVFVDGIVDQYNFQGMDYEKKVAVAKSVNADAFVEFHAFQQIDQSWGFGNLTGNADFAFQTRSNLTMFNLTSEEPILRVQNIDGQKSRNSKELTSGTQMKKLSIIGLESAKSSIKELMKAIKE